MTVAVYLDGEAIGTLTKGPQEEFWYLDEDLTGWWIPPQFRGATHAEQTLEEALKTIEKAIERKKKIVNPGSRLYVNQ